MIDESPDGRALRDSKAAPQEAPLASCEPAALLAAKRDRWIDRDRPPHGEERCDDGDEGEEQRHQDERRWISRCHVPELRLNQLRRSECTAKAGEQAKCDEQERYPVQRAYGSKVRCTTPRTAPQRPAARSETRNVLTRFSTPICSMAMV